MGYKQPIHANVQQVIHEAQADVFVHGVPIFYTNEVFPKYSFYSSNKDLTTPYV